MRDPVDRFESNIAHHIARGEGVDAKSWRDSKKPLNAVAYGKYYLQIGPYINRFGRDRVFLGAFEELVSDQQAFVQRVCGFLGLDSGLIKTEETWRNPRRKTNKADRFALSRKDEEAFVEEVRSDIDCLQFATGIDFEYWWPRYRRVRDNA
jgi:hypothetical protein